MWAGRYRNCPVRVSGVRDWLPPNCAKVPDLMEELVRKYNEEWKNDHPIIKAAKFHCEMIHIHPFFDGNGRTARLMTNYILVRNNFPIITIKHNNKQEYFNAVNDGIVNGNVTGLVSIILKGLETRYKQYVYKINQSQNINKNNVENGEDLLFKVGKTIFYSGNIDNELSMIDITENNSDNKLTIHDYEKFKLTYLKKQSQENKSEKFINEDIGYNQKQNSNTNALINYKEIKNNKDIINSENINNYKNIDNNKNIINSKDINNNKQDPTLKK